MTPENFCYWLQGYFEISQNNWGLAQYQIQIIQDHLNLVFDKKTPDRLEKSWDKEKAAYYPLNTTHTGVEAQGLCGMVNASKIDLGKQFNSIIEKPVC